MTTRAIIAGKGQAVVLTWDESADYDPATGTVVAVEVTVETVGVVLPLSRGLRYMAGTNITAGDQQLLLPGDTARPAIGAKATIGGVDYTLVEVSPLAPAGEALIYDCIIRGAP